jgi:hypothetical protein
MKTKVATIELYIDPELNEPSHSGYRGDRVFAVQVNRGEGDNTLDTRGQFQSVLAHELGHVIGLLSQDETHSSIDRELFDLTGNAKYVLPAERKAWEWASQMLPGLDKETKDKSLATYENASYGSYLSQELPERKPLPLWYWLTVGLFLSVLATLTTLLGIAEVSE